MARLMTRGDGGRGEILNEFGAVVRTRKSMIEAARELRRRMTTAEKLLWDRLRGKSFREWKFYRQVPIDRFIVDFYCPGASLIIELDGSIHDEADIQEYDDLREEFLREKDFHILRFRNEEVMKDLQGVCQRIHMQCKKFSVINNKHTHPPSACGGG